MSHIPRAFRPGWLITAIVDLLSLRVVVVEELIKIKVSVFISPKNHRRQPVCAFRAKLLNIQYKRPYITYGLLFI